MLNAEEKKMRSVVAVELSHYFHTRRVLYEGVFGWLGYENDTTYPVTPPFYYFFII